MRVIGSSLPVAFNSIPIHGLKKLWFFLGFSLACLFIYLFICGNNQGYLSYLGKLKNKRGIFCILKVAVELN